MRAAELRKKEYLIGTSFSSVYLGTIPAMLLLGDSSMNKTDANEEEATCVRKKGPGRNCKLIRLCKRQHG